ncbi:MAG: hypothetical protein HOP29_16740 [Phycisphaerales bacterium]|nr:hypothetical protein [Phycisphaerales bacterium]
MTGDVTAGQTLYADNGCTACHCADASGGCLLDAPALIGVGEDELFGFLVGTATAHPGGKFEFDDQDLLDLEAYLASL